MPRPTHAAFVLTAALLAATALPCRADSFASSASSAGSASSASISDSIGESSNSSSRDRDVADGAYRVMDVAEVPDRPDTLRYTLRATDGGPLREFVLFVPRRALQERPLGTGDLVQTRRQAWGYEFAHADTRRAFFLALNEAWRHDLETRRVEL